MLPKIKNKKAQRSMQKEEGNIDTIKMGVSNTWTLICCLVTQRSGLEYSTLNIHGIEFDNSDSLFPP